MSVDARASVRRRSIGVSILGNAIGAVLTFFYFQYVDITASTSPRPGRVELVFFVVGSLVLLAAFAAANIRWTRPVTRLDIADVRSDTVRRQVLALPYVVAAINFGGWVAAGLVWGVLWPVLIGQFTVASMLRKILGTTGIAGVVVSAFTFFMTERLWRQRLAVLFPRGGLATPGVPRVSVRARLLVIFALVSVVPVVLIGMLAHSRAVAIVQAGPIAGAALMDSMRFFVLFMLAVSVAAAIGLAMFVAESVAAPLRTVERAMAEVGRGNLDVDCPVVTHDEIGAVGEGFNRMVEGLRERERIRETFGRYVTEEVRDEILSGRVDLAGQSREVTMLFADLRDFTPWVEASDPPAVVRDLNEYFTLMEGAIRDHNGLVLQYIGDEIEAVFGAPMPRAGHEKDAVAAAIDMRARLARLNAERTATGRPPLRHGIGIHTGTVLAGNIGSRDRLSYALVGDAVNLASRIQGLTKELGGDILVSGATAQRLSGAFPLEALPAVTVKGKSAAVEVFRVAAR